MPANEFMSPSEVAELLNVDVTRVGSLARERQLVPVHESPRYRLFRRTDVEAFALERAEQARTRRANRPKMPSLIP